MPVLPILEYPDAKLRAKSERVGEFDEKLSNLVDSLFETMYACNGIGLAAPQVGIPVRIFVIDLGAQPGFSGRKHEFINPIIRHASGSISFEEGCLSVPGLGEFVNRNNSVTIDYQDRHGNQASLNAEGLLAVAIQHEFDHLEGILFIDRLSKLKRLFAKRKLRRQVTL